MRIRATHPFYYYRGREFTCVLAGTPVDVPDNIGREQIAAGKAVEIKQEKNPRTEGAESVPPSAAEVSKPKRKRKVKDD